MSPVSRGRKTKKNARKKGPTPPKRPHYEVVDLPQSYPVEPVAAQAFPALPDFGLFSASERHTAWFDTSTKAVLEQADILLTADCLGAVEEATARLLGGELHRVMADDENGPWFTDWFTELTKAAEADVRENRSEKSLRLLHGLAAIGSPALRHRAELAISQVGTPIPDPLRDATMPEATGKVWWLVDVYGSRFGFVVDFASSVFLFDVDAGRAPASLGEVGVFADLETAAEHWRASAGDTARDARPALVDSPERLLPLTQLEFDEQMTAGTETRTTMDNWFRAQRRIHDLDEALRRRGSQLPIAPSLYHDIDVEPMSEAFAAWYRQRHATDPDMPAVFALATDWTEGVLPQVWHSVSSTRVEQQLTMFEDDWVKDAPPYAEAIEMFPDWVRWNGEQTDLPEHLIDQAVEQARRA